MDSRGNRNVLYAYENSDKRNLNLNWDNNEWHENCRFLAVRNFLLSPGLPPTRREVLLRAASASRQEFSPLP